MLSDAVTVSETGQTKTKRILKFSVSDYTLNKTELKYKVIS